MKINGIGKIKLILVLALFLLLIFLVFKFVGNSYHHDYCREKGIKVILSFDENTNKNTLELMKKKLGIKNSYIFNRRVDCSNKNVVVFLEKKNQNLTQKEIEKRQYRIGGSNDPYVEWRKNILAVDNPGGGYLGDGFNFNEYISAVYFSMKPDEEQIKQIITRIQDYTEWSPVREISCQEANKLLPLKLEIEFVADDASSDIKLKAEYEILKEKINKFPGVKIASERFDALVHFCPSN